MSWFSPKSFIKYAFLSRWFINESLISRFFWILRIRIIIFSIGEFRSTFSSYLSFPCFFSFSRFSIFVIVELIVGDCFKNNANHYKNGTNIEGPTDNLIILVAKIQRRSTYYDENPLKLVLNKKEQEFVTIFIDHVFVASVLMSRNDSRQHN